MSDHPHLMPDVNHPISVVPTSGRVRVWLDDAVVADTTDAMTLSESTYPAVQYIPRVDVDAQMLTDSSRSTHCPYKGDANYHGLRDASGTVRPDAAWFYANPFPAVADIADHLAFYPDVVRIEIS